MNNLPETRRGTRLPAGAPNDPETRPQSKRSLADCKHESVTTLGMEIFRSRNLSDIRNQLEKKAVTCRLIGGSDPMLLPVSIQFFDGLLRNAYHLAVITNGKPRLLTLPGEIGDIIRHCWMDGQPAILSTSATPIWGADDLDLLGHVAAIEELETRAMRGGILL